MLTFTQAVQAAESVASWPIGMCDNFVANMYGYSSSGYATALVNWNSIPEQYKHPGDMNAPAGALMFWGGGDGHVAISNGDGSIITTDMPTPGTVSTQPADSPTTIWGKPYLGWSVPYFQGQAGSVGTAQTLSATGEPVQAQTDSFTTDLVGDSKDLAERLGLILLGGALIGVALWKFTDSKTKVSVKDPGDAQVKALKTTDKEIGDATNT